MGLPAGKDRDQWYKALGEKGLTNRFRKTRNKSSEIKFKAKLHKIKELERKHKNLMEWVETKNLDWESN